MLIDFFFHLKARQVSVSITELLDLLAALNHQLADYSIDGFYQLCRVILIKNENQFDKFDRAFGEYFNGIQAALGTLNQEEIPEQWLKKLAERHLTEEEKRQIAALGGWEKLMETLKQRLAQQKERHQGGSKWIGTAGTSPFGAFGYNPEGIRIGQHQSRHRRAVKVWDQRQFRDLDDSVELGTRQIKLALRRLRRFAREGAAETLDLPGTIHSTAHNGGLLEIKMEPERRNAIKVLLFFDVGGSMDDHIKVCEELFSAARSEFKHLEYFYFHNCVYELLWKNNARMHVEKTSTWDLIHTYGPDYKLIFVGDASMSPYEIIYPGASVEHNNPEAGQVWLQRLLETYQKAIWINPVPQAHWPYTQSIELIQEIMQTRMFPLNLEGLERGIRCLTKNN